ncbi:hypothetical protein [Candidatus Electronema sp. JM]|uniref:hypothetical protein n=1 Tax=Candidatus Electronema sp. JM TaxID=3401571 RepID=UPI003AA98053
MITIGRWNHKIKPVRLEMASDAKKARDAKKIKLWMLKNGIKEADIVRATGKSQPYVNQTIHGRAECGAALHYLADKGCPLRILGMKKDSGI